MPIDFKKINKELYHPQIVPSIINVPEMRFIYPTLAKFRLISRKR